MNIPSNKSDFQQLRKDLNMTPMQMMHEMGWKPKKMEEIESGKVKMTDKEESVFYRMVLARMDAMKEFGGCNDSPNFKAW